MQSTGVPESCWRTNMTKALPWSSLSSEQFIMLLSMKLRRDSFIEKENPRPFMGYDCLQLIQMAIDKGVLSANIDCTSHPDPTADFDHAPVINEVDG